MKILYQNVFWENGVKEEQKHRLETEGSISNYLSISSTRDIGYVFMLPIK